MCKENYAFLLYTVSAQLHPDYIFVEFRLLMTPNLSASVISRGIQGGNDRHAKILVAFGTGCQRIKGAGSGSERAANNNAGKHPNGRSSIWQLERGRQIRFPRHVFSHISLLHSYLLEFSLMRLFRFLDAQLPLSNRLQLLHNASPLILQDKATSSRYHAGTHLQTTLPPQPRCRPLLRSIPHLHNPHSRPRSRPSALIPPHHRHLPAMRRH
jgi:hypothetical protein